MSALETFEVRSVERDNCREYWICSSGNSCETHSVISDIVDFLAMHKAEAVSVRLFGRKADIEAAADFIAQSSGKLACPPLMIIQNEPSVSVQVHAFSGLTAKPLYFRDEFAGKEFEDGNIKYFMLNVLPDDKSVSEYDQAVNLFDKANLMLERFGAKFSDTVRTWLYADRILDWYDYLNKARNNFFEKHDIYNKRVPASTGIGAANPEGKAMTAQVLAIIPRNGKVRIYPAASPLQCPALDYKSSFSRGMVIEAPDHQRLYISGTASIDTTGETVFIDNVEAQLDMTMRVVAAMLKEAGMDWCDTVSSLVYFKRREYFDLFDAYCGKHGIKLPHIKLHADVCRDNLLFELELDAVKARH